MIRAAFFDIDGTLLSFRTHRVSPGTVRAFKTLHDHGVHTFISSGRPMVLIPEMPVSFEAYITMNGAHVFTHDTTLLSNPVPDSDLQAWVEHARRNHICTMTFTSDSMMAANIDPVGMRLQAQLDMPMPPVVDIEEMLHHQTYQIIAIMPPEQDAEVSALLPHCRLPRWCDIFTDIVAAGNSKAMGMEAVCRHFGIRQEETIAFGDGGNDIEMLQWAGKGIAMGNADDNVKRHADMVTTRVDDEGIENAVKLLL